MIVCNVVFDLYRSLNLIYLVKQTSDITREALKTSKFLNEYRFSGSNEMNEEFRIKVINY